jgi:lambda family phage portal protein
MGKGSELMITGGRMLSAMASAAFNASGLAPNGAYNGASSIRQALRAWRASKGSADLDTLSNLETLRARSRDLVRNTPTAAAIVSKKTINVVNTGLRWKSRIDAGALGLSPDAARDYEKKLSDYFDRWASSKDADAARGNNFYQMQALAYRGQLESGDIFAALPVIERRGLGSRLCVKLIESDLCVSPPGVSVSRKLAGGIEIDEWGAPVAYWFTQSHVEDLELSTAPMIRVPAYGEKTGRPLVLHVFSSLRPGQRRGVPALAPVIEPLKNLGRYLDAELMAAVVSGMFTVFIKTAAGLPGQGNVPPSALVGGTGEKGDLAPFEMSYGGVVDLAAGEEIQTADPSRPNPNFDPFVSSILKEVGGALGIGAEMIQGQYSSSYTAARASFLDAYRGFKVDIKNLEVDLCEPVKGSVLLHGVLSGDLDLPGYLADPAIRALWESGQWVAPAPGQLDPLKETQAYALQVREQFTSRRIAAQELRGEEYRHIVSELAEEQEWRGDAGIPDPLESVQGAASGPAGNEATDPGAANTADPAAEQF